MLPIYMISPASESGLRPNSTAFFRSCPPLSRAPSLVTKLNRLECKSDCMVYRIDINNFYLSGDPWSIAKLVASLFNEKNSELIYDIALFLLYEQFIESSEHPDRVFRVQHGTGMGLIHSGSVADGALHALIERDFAARADIQKRHGIICDKRFRDDILFIATSPRLAREFFWGMQRAAKDIFSMKAV